MLAPSLLPGAVALDVGCGGGYVTAAMAWMVGSQGRVYGTDLHPELVAFARHNIRQQNPELSPTIDVQVCLEMFALVM